MPCKRWSNVLYFGLVVSHEHLRHIPFFFDKFVIPSAYIVRFVFFNHEIVFLNRGQRIAKTFFVDFKSLFGRNSRRSIGRIFGVSSTHCPHNGKNCSLEPFRASSKSRTHAALVHFLIESVYRIAHFALILFQCFECLLIKAFFRLGCIDDDRSLTATFTHRLGERWTNAVRSRHLVLLQAAKHEVFGNFQFGIAALLTMHGWSDAVRFIHTLADVVHLIPLTAYHFSDLNALRSAPISCKKCVCETVTGANTVSSAVKCRT